MKNKVFNLKNIICFLLLIALIAGLLNLPASASSRYSTKSVEKIIGGVISYKQKQAKASSVQKLIDTGLSKKAGTNYTDWTMIGLIQYKGKYNYSKYNKALDYYVSNTKRISATDLQRIALVYSATKGNSSFVTKTIKNSVGKLGIMSYIYGLILLDSRNYTCKDYNRTSIVKKILSLRLKDGGWALNGTTSDVDVTAMAIQALAPYYKDKNVKSAVNKALTLLSKRQLNTGDYKSWGTRCSESGAQVIAALSALKIDCQTDKRFIKNNKTLIDGLMQYKLKDGSFAHTIGGKSNDTSSVQAMYSLISYWRYKNNKSSFYKY